VTYGGTVARYHFKYVLMNPSMHPDVREALAKELEHRGIKTGKKIALATLKADKFYDACDKNWVHIAEHRDLWRECVVKIQLLRPGRARKDEVEMKEKAQREMGGRGLFGNTKFSSYPMQFYTVLHHPPLLKLADPALKEHGGTTVGA
jgi:hypothetical protein